MSPRARKLLRLLGRLAYAGVVLVCFGASAYFAFKMFVRSGVTQTPEVVGLAPEEARALLADQGLTFRRAEGGDRFDPEVPAGAILKQDPAPHTLVKRGGVVEVAVSLGPERLDVPDLRGQSLASAQVALAAAGLTPGRTLSVFDVSDPGTVVRQKPASGTPVAPQTPVDLFLSTGGLQQAFLMPDLVYEDYERIRTFFENRGFHFGSVKFETYEGATPGIVLRQFPLAGHPVSRDDAISLVVAAPAGGTFETAS